MEKLRKNTYLQQSYFVGHCKNAMVGLSGTSKLGTIYYYYSCNGTRKKECHKKNVPKRQIEDIVISKCRSLLTNKNIEMISKEVYAICQKENNQNTLLKCLMKRHKELENNIANLMKAIEAGQNLDLINDSLTKRRNELEDVEKQIAVEKMNFTNLTKDQIKSFLLLIKNGNKNDIKYRKTLISIFVNKIYLYDDRLTIIFNVGSNPITADVPIIDNITNSNNNELGLYLNKLSSPLTKSHTST